MKAIFIPYTFDPDRDLEKLNQSLKDVYSIKFHTDVNRETNKEGTILIVRNHTRKDKLLELKRISNENKKGTNNNII